jgi:hypothetical protein
MHERFEVAQNVPAVHSIGSKRRSLLRLSVLILITCSVLALHYFLLSKRTDWAVLVLVGSWFGVIFRFLVRRRLHKSVDFVLKDSAYGVVSEEGIRYRSMLRLRFTPWSSVARIEYSPRDSHRIDVFKVGAFTFSRVRPVHFGPAPSNAKVVQEIEKILNRQGTPEKLVTTDRLPEKFFHL